MSINPAATIHEAQRNVRNASLQHADCTVTLSPSLFICISRDKFIDLVRRDVAAGVQVHYRRATHAHLCIETAHPTGDNFLAPSDLKRQDIGTIDVPLPLYARADYAASNKVSEAEFFRRALDVATALLVVAILVAFCALIMRLSRFEQLSLPLFLVIYLLKKIFGDTLRHAYARLRGHFDARVLVAKALLETALAQLKIDDDAWLQGDPTYGSGEKRD